MSVKLAETAGFCMGVRRAVDMVLELAQHKGQETIYTYGPLIHNPQTVELLRKRGIVPIDAIGEIPADTEGAGLIIRAHGISPQERKLLREKNLKIIDATCPKVGRVQAIIKKHAARDYAILIIGDAGHPEVNGLLGYAFGKGLLLAAVEDVHRLPPLDKVCVVAQTTQSVDEYRRIVAAIRARFPDAVIFDTICDSTERRQNEVKALAEEMDAMIIVGGRNSANTQRLADLAALPGRPAFHVETSEELPLEQLAAYKKIGISAGASTPNWIIDRVVDAVTTRQAEEFKQINSLFRFWTWMVRTDIYSALGAGCLTATAMLFQGLKPRFLYMVIAALYVYAMHTLNRFINRKTGSIIGSFREESYHRHESGYLTAAILALAFSLGAGMLSGGTAFLFLLAMSILGILYNVQLAPPGWSYRGIGDLPGSKNITVAFAWAAVAAVLPPVAERMPLTGAMAVSLAFIFGLVFVRSVLSDLLGVQNDKLVGKETIPVLIGNDRTQQLLNLIVLALASMLAAAPFAVQAASLSYFLIIPVIYIWICFRLYDRKPSLLGVVKEGVLETAYIIAGLSAWAWYLVCGGEGL
ncbi:MAG: 4-hydroxy-3-methylbut-2-enyl diphosphate reductase [Pseudomonadota bacterium]|nr:4-hydroxy-3-methylbut-2-enyl diphosphate reductase [Pseudomonadota bacterium]